MIPPDPGWHFQVQRVDEFLRWLYAPAPIEHRAYAQLPGRRGSVARQVRADQRDTPYPGYVRVRR